MSRTVPDAVRRRGGIRVEELRLFGGLKSVEVGSGAGAGVLGWAGVPVDVRCVDCSAYCLQEHFS